MRKDIESTRVDHGTGERFFTVIANPLAEPRRNNPFVSPAASMGTQGQGCAAELSFPEHTGTEPAEGGCRGFACQQFILNLWKEQSLGGSWLRKGENLYCSNRG